MSADLVDRLVTTPKPPPQHPLPVRAWRNPMFIGRCMLCGCPIDPGQVYCHEHKWAAGL